MNNHPAFPRPASEYTAQGTLSEGNEAIAAQQGMSLRDYFAAQALNGMCAHNWGVTAHARMDELTFCPAAATDAYRLADAMFAEREKETAEDPYAAVREYAGDLKKLLAVYVEKESESQPDSLDMAHARGMADAFGLALANLKGFTSIEPSGGE